MTAAAWTAAICNAGSTGIRPAAGGSAARGYTLRMELLADGKFAYGEERDIEVWPDAIPPAAGDAAQGSCCSIRRGRRRMYSRRPAWPFRTGEAGGAGDQAGARPCWCWVRARCRGDEEAAGRRLAAFADAGGRIVVLMQGNLLPCLPVRTTLGDRRVVQHDVPAHPQHPILKGLDAWDLQFWAAGPRDGVRLVYAAGRRFVRAVGRRRGRP